MDSSAPEQPDRQPARQPSRSTNRLASTGNRIGLIVETGIDRNGTMERMVESPTILLQRLRAGDGNAAPELFDQLYPELHLIAQRVFRSQGGPRGRGHTLQPTVLVHEAYMKMVGGASPPEWQSRAHFCNIAARAMRQILVNHARDKSAQKRGGPDAHKVTLHDHEAQVDESHLEVLALDEALSQLQAVSERQARIAELKLFGGLSSEEIAESLSISKRSAELDWKMAKAWLTTKLAS